MWKLLLTQFKVRASRPLCILPVIAGFIATFVYWLFAKNGSPSTQIKVAPLVFIAGVLFAIAGYFWFKKPLGNIKLTCCHNCNFNLLGHEEVPDLCPECGISPTPLTESAEHILVGYLSLIPGILFTLMSLGCLLLTLLYLYLLNQSGALSE